ncbi:MAG: hypothetical protein H0W84_06795 [Bacteroidetes bacterium]|nr:hypothetical protein [Bacteroidota bacterium]
MNDKEKKLRYNIIRNCEPNMYTPLWESISFISDLYPNVNEEDKIKIGVDVITDLIKRNLINLYLGTANSSVEYELISDNQIKEYLEKKEYWNSDTAPDLYIELLLRSDAIDIAIGKIPYEKTFTT